MHVAADRPPGKTTVRVRKVALLTINITSPHCVFVRVCACARARTHVVVCLDERWAVSRRQRQMCVCLHQRLHYCTKHLAPSVLHVCSGRFADSLHASEFTMTNLSGQQ